MYQIPPKIKLCTCATKNARELKNYWVLHNYNKNKGIIIVGEVMVDFNHMSSDYKANQKILLQRLNEPDVFDTHLAFQNKQVLELVLNSSKYQYPFTHCFQYHNGTWKNKKYEPFDLEMHYNEIAQGKFRSK